MVVRACRDDFPLAFCKVPLSLSCGGRVEPEDLAVTSRDALMAQDAC